MQISATEATTPGVADSQLVFGRRVKTAQWGLTGPTAREHLQAIALRVKTLAMVIITGVVLVYLQAIANLAITAQLERTEHIVQAFRLVCAPNAQTMEMDTTTQGVVECQLVRVSHAETARLECTGVSSARGFPLVCALCVRTLVWAFSIGDVAIFLEVNHNRAIIALWEHIGSTARAYHQGPAPHVRAMAMAFTTMDAVGCLLVHDSRVETAQQECTGRTALDYQLGRALRVAWENIHHRVGQLNVKTASWENLPLWKGLPHAMNATPPCACPVFIEKHAVISLIQSVLYATIQLLRMRIIQSKVHGQILTINRILT